MLLLLLILIPLIAAGLVAFAPSSLSKPIAMLGGLAQFALAIVLMGLFNWSETDPLAQNGLLQFSLTVVEPLGITFDMGVDAVAVWLIALTGFLTPLMVLGSFTAITNRVKTYYAWLLALQGVLVAVFAALDIILFYICFEFTLVPMFILISLYGSTNRKKAAIKMFLYTFFGSLIALAGLVYVAAQAAAANAGEWTFAIVDLETAARAMSAGEQAWVLLALMIGFGVKVPIFPLHTWLPLAHTEAPTAGSVILAGVLLKLGTYAIYRFVLPFVPDAVMTYAPVIATLAIIGILAVGLVCWVQRDVKKLVAYSSVAHLGFCVLGMFALTGVGVSGSILYMINHGLSTGALFFCIGMMYERYHTRSMDEIGGLAQRMPVWAFFMGFFTMASVGLPGLNGFVSEVMCLLGTWQSGADGVGGVAGGPLGPWYAAVAGAGMIVAAMYLLYMMGKVVFGPLKEPAHHHDDDDSHSPKLPADLSIREIAVLTPLAIACLVFGLFPTQTILPTLEQPVAETVEIYQSGALEIEQADEQPATEAQPAQQIVLMETNALEPALSEVAQ